MLTLRPWQYAVWTPTLASVRTVTYKFRAYNTAGVDMTNDLIADAHSTPFFEAIIPNQESGSPAPIPLFNLVVTDGAGAGQVDITIAGLIKKFQDIEFIAGQLVTSDSGTAKVHFLPIVSRAMRHDRSGTVAEGVLAGGSRHAYDGQPFNCNQILYENVDASGLFIQAPRPLVIGKAPSDWGGIPSVVFTQ